MSLPDRGNPIRDSDAAASRQGHAQPDAGRAAALRHVPVTGDASSDQLTAFCADLRPGIPVLALAYPEFTVSEPRPGRNGPAWAVIRKEPAQPGLYAAVTPDFAELRDVLARHATRQPDRSDQGT